MLVQKLYLLLACSFLSIGVFAQSSSSSRIQSEDLFIFQRADSRQNPEQKSRVKLSEKAQKKETVWSFVLPTFVIHGIQPDKDVATMMPGKMDGAGDSVMTPGLGIQHVGDDNSMFLGAVVKDCFNNLAATIQFGELYRESKTFNWGWSFGFYARQTPYICEPGINGKKDCFPVADFPLKMNTKIGGSPVDVMPMPFLHLSYRMVDAKDFKMDLKILANFFINEVGIEIPL